jgi:hypothetical protein
VQETSRLLQLLDEALDIEMDTQLACRLSHICTQQYSLPGLVAKLIVWVQQQPQLCTAEGSEGNLHAKLWRGAMRSGGSLLHVVPLCYEEEPLLVEQSVMAFDDAGEAAAAAAAAAARAGPKLPSR